MIAAQLPAADRSSARSAFLDRFAVDRRSAAGEHAMSATLAATA
jgi:hypothetical protein